MDGHQRWLEVQADSGTCVYSLSRCLALADLQADGDYKLIIADIGGPQNTLKILKGMSVIAETTLPELPSGVATFYNDSRHPRCPIVAVASGPSIYCYRNLKPYYKFSLPLLEVNALEVDLWLQVRNAGIESKALCDLLSSLQNEIGFSRLCQQSQNLLLLKADNEITAYISAVAPHPLSRKSIITCMTSLQKATSDADAVSCLVIGSEDGSITFVDTEAFTVIDKIEQHEDHGVRTIPAILQCSGLLDVEFRVLVCNRDGKITLIRRGWKNSKVLVQLAVQPVDMIFSENAQLLIATATHLECYSKKVKCLLTIMTIEFRAISCCHDIKGRLQWVVQLSVEASGLCKIALEHLGMTLIAVTAKGGQIHIYNNRNLVDVIHAPDSVTAITFGRFGQEDHCLILVTAGGLLLVKMLKRTAQFLSTSVQPISQAARKLSLPKKTRLLIEQIARERDNAIEIHQGFQRGLFRLRLNAARNLAESIQKLNLISDDSELPLKMSAQVFGLGPTFKIRLSLDNMAAALAKTPSQLRVLVHYNHALYHVSRPYFDLPHLVPGLMYTFEIMVTSICEVLLAEEVYVFLLNEKSTKPVLSAAVHIPVCDLLPIEI